MTSPIDPDELLSTARLLAGRSQLDPVVAPPLTSSDLRRATSTAYYAVFHQIALHGSFDFLPGASSGEAAEVARWFSHTGIARAAGNVVDVHEAADRPVDQLPKALVQPAVALRAAGGGFSLDAGLVTLAQSFIALQAARHSADYDGGHYLPSLTATLNDIQDAEQALGAARSLWGRTEDRAVQHPSAAATYRVFLRLALLHSGGPKAR